MASPPSLASQLPQVPGSRITPPFVGAGLAHDGSTAVRQSCRIVCIAGKPAPTMPGRCAQPGLPRDGLTAIAGKPAPTGTGEPHHSTLCGSRACPRWQHRGPAVMSNCLHRWQASSHNARALRPTWITSRWPNRHRWQASSHRYRGAAPLHPLWEPGLPAMAAPRAGSHVELSASLASQLPQCPGVVYNL